jgi:PAS domain S-box-containing protein
MSITKYKLSIRTWLFILVFACWIPLGVFVFGQFLANDQNAARVAAIAQMRELARTTSAAIELTLRDNEAMMRLLAEEFKGNPPAKIPGFQAEQFMEIHPLVNNLTLHDLDANNLYSYLPNPTLAQEAKNFSWVKNAIAAEGFQASGVFMGRLSGRWVSVFTYPTHDHAGRKTGFIGASIDLMRLNARLLGKIPSTTAVAVLDRDGNFLLRAHDAEGWIGKSGPTGLSSAAASQSEGVLQVQSVEGVSKLVSYVTNPLTGWRVVAGMPVDIALADYYALRRKTLWTGLLLVLTSLVLAWGIASLIAAPITALAQASQNNVESATAIPVVPSGPLEIQTVARQFNRMVESQHRSLARLAESEARWKFALEGSGDGVWDWNFVTRHAFYSRRRNEILGFEDGELPSTIDEWAIRTHQEDYARVVAVGRAHMNGESPSYATTFRIRCKDDSYKWVLSRGLVVERDHHGHPLRMVGTITDFSQVKQRDDDLRTAAIAFDSQLPMYILDAECHFRRINRAFTEMTGLTLEELQGRRPEMLLAQGKNDPERIESFWKRLAQTGEASDEFLAHSRFGDSISIITNLSVVKNDSASVVGYVGTLTDVTERKRQQVQREAEQEAHRTALVREVHHRVKNNLQGMIGILREFGRSHPETMEPLSQVISQIQSISVIHGLQGETSLSQVRLCELTESIASSISAARQVRIAFHRPDAWQPCIIESREAVPIALVLNELILNAVKHGDATKGAVRIAMEKGESESVVRIVISNFGDWSQDAKDEVQNYSAKYATEARKLQSMTA